MKDKMKVASAKSIYLSAHGMSRYDSFMHNGFHSNIWLLSNNAMPTKPASYFNCLCVNLYGENGAKKEVDTMWRSGIVMMMVRDYDGVVWVLKWHMDKWRFK